MKLNLQYADIQRQSSVVDEMELFNQQSAIESLLDECEALYRTAEQLTIIQTTIKRYGWTPSMESLFGEEFRDNNIGCSVEGVVSAVGKGIAAFARALVNVIKKIISFVQNLLSKRDKSRMSKVGDLPQKIGSIQNEKMNGANCPTKENIIKFCDVIKKHYTVELSASREDLGENAKVDVMRKAYIDEFNSKCGQEAQVDMSYKLKYSVKAVSGKRLREYGFVGMTDLTAADNALQDALNGANGVINDLKHSGEETAKIAKALETHTFREGSADTATLQATYVFCRIIFNDLALLRRTNGQFGNLIEVAKKVSKGYVSTGKAPTKQEMEEESKDRDTQPEEQQTPEPEKK